MTMSTSRPILEPVEAPGQSTARVSARTARAGRRRTPRALGVALGAVLVAAIALAPARADAASLRLGLGANYWFTQQGVFDVDLAVTARVAPILSVGGRFGAALVTNGPVLAVPLDLLLHFPIERLYLEAMAGPWIFFEGDAVRAHVAIGFGLTSGPISVGLEAGYLDPRGIIGARFGYRF